MAAGKEENGAGVNIKKKRKKIGERRGDAEMGEGERAKEMKELGIS